MNDVEALKVAFSEIDLMLETEQIRFELEDEMQLQVEVACDELSAVASVKLNDEYKLVISPAISGFNGAKNWIKWREITHQKTGQILKLSQVRCTVSLVAPTTESGEETIFSFGLDAPNMEQLVPKALEKIHVHCGLRLVALPVVKKPSH